VWIEDGEKYALIGLSVNVEGELPTGGITQNLSVLSDTVFDLPPNWREWLGSIRVERIEQCNLFFLSKLASSSPDVLDDENQILQRHVRAFYYGLFLACFLAPAYSPVMLTGARQNGEIGVRQTHDFDTPLHTVVRRYPAVVPPDLQLAAQLGENLIAMATTPSTGEYWRLFRTLDIYTKARCMIHTPDRIHQYCRCIDGIILPDVGKTKRQFKSRTELFIGPHHHDMMGLFYNIRGDVENLHEYRYLEVFDRATRLDLLEKEAIVEHIARTSLARIVGNHNLSSYFGNMTALARFWALTPVERQGIWGDAIDPLAAIADFSPDLIHDGSLGAR